jgi:hypothetical protein
LIRFPASARFSASVAVAAVAVVAIAQQPAARSDWAHLDRSGKLAYKTTGRGDRILDFSYAGYMGGGVRIPDAAVKKRVSPSGADDSAAIQAAVDEVAKLPLVGGFRGAVLLSAGRFQVSQTIKVAANGVVLRGSGAGEHETLIEMAGDPHQAFLLAGECRITPMGSATMVADTYVPAGAMSFTVRDASGFHAGDVVQVVRPSTEKWVHFMDMDSMVRGGKRQTWVGGDIKAERRITAVKGKRLVFDVPLADSYDASLLGADGTTVTKISETGLLEQVGVENLRIVAPARKVTLNDKHFNGIAMKSVKDGWIRSVRIMNTTGPVNVDHETQRVTVTRVDITQAEPLIGAAKSADFSIDGSQILVDRSTAIESNVFYIATGARKQGPNVVLHCAFHGDGHVQPHQRWSTGLLVDSTEVPEGGIDLMNRGAMGSGHGWTMGWGVAWNNVARSFVIQSPPGAVNWGIGNRGEQQLKPRPTFDPGPPMPLLPQGTLDSDGTAVAPASLYLEQLKERLGEKALRNIGY